MSIYEAAKSWVDRGIAVIPIARDGNGKKPALDSWKRFQTELPTERELWAWFANNGADAYGIVCGGPGKLAVMDFDDQGLYDAWLYLAKARGGLAEQVARETYQVQTRKGVHVYVRSQADEATIRASHEAGFDLQAIGSYVLGEGSRHPEGGYYTRKVGAPETIATVPNAAAVFGEILSLNLYTRPKPKQTVTTAKPPHVPQAPLPVAANVWDALAQPREPETATEYVKARVSFRDVLPGLQSSDNDAGRWFLGPCPFHDDASPSFWWDDQKRHGACFSGCYGGQTMDEIDVWARLHRMSNGDAIGAMARLIRAGKGIL